MPQDPVQVVVNVCLQELRDAKSNDAIGVSRWRCCFLCGMVEPGNVRPPLCKEVVRFLSLVFAGVCGGALNPIEQLEVLGEHKQAGFRASSRQATAVETL